MPVKDTGAVCACFFVSFSDFFNKKNKAGRFVPLMFDVSAVNQQLCKP